MRTASHNPTDPEIARGDVSNMRITVLCFLAVVFWCPTRQASTAVRCAPQLKSVAGTLKQSDAVFVGEVIEANDATSFREARLRVEQSWKGAETSEVRVVAPRTIEAPRYQVGERYLVFASLQDGKLFTANCSRTKRIDHAAEDLKQLGAGKKPKA